MWQSFIRARINRLQVAFFDILISFLKNHALFVFSKFFISGNFYSSFVSTSLAYITQGLKKVPSSRPGQTDFLPRQIIFKFTDPMGKGLSKSSSN